MKAKLETLVLVRGITGFIVRVVDVLIVGLLTRLAVLATWREGYGGPLSELLWVYILFKFSLKHEV